MGIAEWMSGFVRTDNMHAAGLQSQTLNPRVQSNVAAGRSWGENSQVPHSEQLGKDFSESPPDVQGVAQEQGLATLSECNYWYNKDVITAVCRCYLYG